MSSVDGSMAGGKAEKAEKFRRQAMEVSAAQACIIPYAHLLDSEWVVLAEAQGRTLAENITAPHPYPHFRRSGMDGFAIISADTKGCSSEQPVELRVVDEIPCGNLPGVKLVPGTAARIMTGAKVPDEADAVIMFEMTKEMVKPDGDLQHKYIEIRREIEVGKNVTPIGLELAEGDLILEKGRSIGTGEISVLATFGIHQVPVVRRPRVAVFSTGSELLSVEEPLQDGKIRNSNTYMLANQIREAGGEPYILHAIEDDLELARSKVAAAFAQYDIVITTGGVSVGDFDIMADLVAGDDVQMLFNKVQMRPGSVTTVAVKEDKLLFALSGNPGACFVGFELFARPAIQKMLGSSRLFLPEFSASLGKDYSKVNSFTRFVRGRLDYSDGSVVAYPAELDESSVMITIKDSDVLIVIPPTTAGVHAGEMVKVLKLPRGTV